MSRRKREGMERVGNVQEKWKKIHKLNSMYGTNPREKREYLWKVNDVDLLEVTVLQITDSECPENI